MEKIQTSESIDLLWTGGWDSTFRLLQILLEEKRKVQPFYVIDPERNSTGVEIQSMHRVKNILNQKYPHTRALFSPTKYINLESIEPDEAITNAYETLKKYVPLGNQYEWLPRFCKQHNYHAVELAIENIENKEDRWPNYPYFKNNFSDEPDRRSEKEHLIYSTSKTLFQYFSFPIIHLTKKETFSIAQRNGWLPILGKTWFCYQPLYVPFRGLTPCGNCITCKHQMKYGLYMRIPLYVKVFQRMRAFKKNFTSISK